MRQSVLMIPGLCCTARLYRDQAVDLCADHWVHITEEHIRHDDISAIASSLLTEAPDSFALVGLSFGGYIGFEILRQAPDRVSHLALLNTSAQADTPEKRQNRLDLIALAEKGRFLGVSDRLWPTFIAEARYGETDLVDDVKKMASDVGKDGFLRQQKAIMGRPDSLDLLPAIDCPTMVLVGRQDLLTPVEEAKLIEQGIPHADLIVLEDCGHLSTMERPAVVTQHLRNLLSR